MQINGRIVTREREDATTSREREKKKNPERMRVFSGKDWAEGERFEPSTGLPL
jgi:hypothetical protein